MKTLLLGAAAMATVLVPAAAFAQTYAYVNTTGEVMTTDAATADQALMTAPGISVHSGVMIVEADDQNVLGDNVSGI